MSTLELLKNVELREHTQDQLKQLVEWYKSNEIADGNIPERDNHIIVELLAQIIADRYYQEKNMQAVIKKILL